MANELTIGVDLGGTKIEAALVDESGRVVKSRRTATAADRSHEAVIDSIADCIRDLLHDSGAIAVGIGVAGQIDSDAGIVRFAPNLRWHQVPLADALRTAVGLPVHVVNDVRAATFGEWAFGAAQKSTHCVAVFLGTGIGGGIVANGALLDGCTNTAGEVGHVTIVAGGRKCTCPSRGCLEAYAGGWAIAERVREAVQKDPAAGKTIVQLAGDPANISAETLAQAFQARDPLAVKLVQETALYLGAGLVSILNTVNPCVIVIGGGVAEGMPELVELAIDHAVKNALPGTTRRGNIVKATLPPHSGTIGAAALARRTIRPA